MAFCTSGAQLETTRKILEDLQVKKQLLQKGVTSTVLPSFMNQATLPIELSQSLVSVPSRTIFNLNNTTTLGFFVQQDSHYGNTFIPVLPRFDSTQASNNSVSN